METSLASQFLPMIPVDGRSVDGDDNSELKCVKGKTKINVWENLQKRYIFIQ